MRHAAAGMKHKRFGMEENMYQILQARELTANLFEMVVEMTRFGVAIPQ